jgi:Tfp pilus assembly protein PilF
LHYLLGEVAVRQGRKADAETEFKKSLALKADLVPAQLALASVYVVSNKPLAAEEAYRQALDIASDALDLANVHFLYGKFLESPDRRRPFDAIAEYSAALSLDPSNEQAKQALDQLIASTRS